VGLAVIFRQLFDPESCTYSYLLGDPATRAAVLIDPVVEQLERDVGLLSELQLRLAWSLETHVHADHVTASGRLRERLGARIAVGARAGVANADLALDDGATLRVGALRLEVLATPGHTAGCVSYLCRAAGLAFTGDALLVRGCGRTDFQGGDAEALLRSVRERIFALPDETLLYPAHDYRGRTVTTVAEEKRWNPRLGLGVAREEFLAIMAGLALPPPKRIDVAVPANLVSGLVACCAPEPPSRSRSRSAAGRTRSSSSQRASKRPTRAARPDACVGYPSRPAREVDPMTIELNHTIVPAVRVAPGKESVSGSPNGG
jgi:glyoxylase-like metal-dependent hydrolase (beta-lactamase superfamily II)